MEPGAVHFSAFYSAEYIPLRAIALGLVKDPAAAEDLVQEAMTSALMRWSDVGGFDEPRAWVRRVMLNAAASRFRRIRSEIKGLARLVQPAAVDPAPLPDEPLWMSVRRLPLRQRQIVVLTYVGELTTREIADLLECAESTVRVHLSRARAGLRASLNGEEEEG